MCLIFYSGYGCYIYFLIPSPELPHTQYYLIFLNNAIVLFMSVVYVVFLPGIPLMMQEGFLGPFPAKSPDAVFLYPFDFQNLIDSASYYFLLIKAVYFAAMVFNIILPPIHAPT